MFLLAYRANSSTNICKDDIHASFDKNCLLREMAKIIENHNSNKNKLVADLTESDFEIVECTFIS